MNKEMREEWTENEKKKARKPKKVKNKEQIGCTPGAVGAKRAWMHGFHGIRFLVHRATRARQPGITQL